MYICGQPYVYNTPATLGDLSMVRFAICIRVCMSDRDCSLLAPSTETCLFQFGFLRTPRSSSSNIASGEGISIADHFSSFKNAKISTR